ncbi:MAG TPA: rod shape-determining protein MreC, partial [Gemmatimonadales bacterium]|nr:rod shape-determining protein MreC [Gemmatimonadales bacterium]
GCLALSVTAMSVPDSWRRPFSQALRQTVLAPLLTLQEETETLKSSKAHIEAVTAQRDSAMLAATFLPELRSENARLRNLLGLGTRLETGYVPAEVLHESVPTDPLTFLVSAGRRDGVKTLDAVVSPEGLVGVVSAVDEKTSVVATWAHPEFRAAAMAVDGSVYGIVAPHGAEGPGIWLLELQGVPYRSVVPDSALIVSSGLGGVIPRGIPLGTVMGQAVDNEHWERTYLIRPAVHPASVTHVMIITGATAGRGTLRDLFQAEAKSP